jgi:hypothetical protein
MLRKREFKSGNYGGTSTCDAILAGWPCVLRRSLHKQLLCHFSLFRPQSSAQDKTFVYICSQKLLYNRWNVLPRNKRLI